MRNTEIVVFYDSNKRNFLGFRKMDVKIYTYDNNLKCKIRHLKTLENLKEAEEFCLSKGWGKRGYKKNVLTGEVIYLN